MVYKILIVGLKELDAGKTSLACAMLDYFRARGYSVCGFKPRAGNSIWYDYDVVQEALSRGRLYGKDAKMLKLASTPCSVSGALEEEFVNPFHRLWTEPPHIDPVTRIPYFIIDRVTLWRKSEATNLVVVNDALPTEYRYDEALFNDLCSGASRIFHVHDLNTLNKLTSEYYNRAAEQAFMLMCREYELIVIESYSDVALPLPYSTLKDVDAVIGIKPGKIFVFEPEKYLTAVQLEASIRIQAEEPPTSEIVELLKPVREIRVPPLRSDEVVPQLKKRVPLILK
ncbi:MAG: hypothetical protein C4B56_00905 [Candidatus Methanophagaceae archaeon]|nr:MAG: hypothetical protein C4B56_00905 [Methanophagales archaeon]